MIICTLICSSVFTASCSKPPSGKDGFFDTASSLDALFSSVSSDLYTDAISKLLKNNTVKSDYTFALKGGELEDELKFTYNSVVSNSQQIGVDSLDIGYKDGTLDFTLYRTDSGAYLDSDAMFGKYLNVTDLYNYKTDSEEKNSEQTDMISRLISGSNASLLKDKIIDAAKQNITDEHFTDSLDTITADEKAREINVITLTLTDKETRELIRKISDTLKEDDEALDALADILCPDASADEVETKTAERLDYIVSEITDSDDNMALQYSRGIYKKLSVYENIVCGTENDFKLLYIFADGEKDTATLDVTLDSEKIIDAEYTLEGNVLNPTRRINVKLPQTQIYLVSQTTSASLKKNVSDVTLDIISDTKTSIGGQLTVEFTSTTSFNIDFDGKFNSDTSSNDITLHGTTDLDSKDEISLPDITSDQVYNLDSAAGKAEFAFDLALKPLKNCPELYELLFK